MQSSTHEYTIRQLNEEEWPTYKQFRLEALTVEPAMFRITNPLETSLTDDEWQERIKHPRAVFVLEDNTGIVGMTSIILQNEQEAYLGQSYIKKEHRGKGLSTLLYDARMAWANNLELDRLQTSHRETNVVSKAANQRLGFKYTHRESVHWNDGAVEDVLYYTLDLR